MTPGFSPEKMEGVYRCHRLRWRNLGETDQKVREKVAEGLDILLRHSGEGVPKGNSYINLIYMRGLC